VPFSSATEGSHLLLFSDNLLFQLDEAFYAGASFLIIFTLAYVVVRLIGLFIRITLSPLGKQGKIIAGVLSIATTYFGLQMLLVTLSLVPLATVQSHIDASGLDGFTYPDNLGSFTKFIYRKYCPYQSASIEMLALII